MGVEGSHHHGGRELGDRLSLPSLSTHVNFNSARRGGTLGLAPVTTLAGAKAQKESATTSMGPNPTVAAAPPPHLWVQGLQAVQLAVVGCLRAAAASPPCWVP